jgi:hypothetical protein
MFMSRWLPLTVLLLSVSSVLAGGCTDPNPTFVFDAAPANRDGGPGTDASNTDGGQAGDDATQDASDDASDDANPDATGGSP